MAVTQKTEHVLSNKMRSYQRKKLLPNHLHFFPALLPHPFQFFKDLKIASFSRIASSFSFFLSFSTFIIFIFFPRPFILFVFVFDCFPSSTNHKYCLKLTHKPHCYCLILFDKGTHANRSFSLSTKLELEFCMKVFVRECLVYSDVFRAVYSDDFI